MEYKPVRMRHLSFNTKARSDDDSINGIHDLNTTCICCSRSSRISNAGVVQSVATWVIVNVAMIIWKKIKLRIIHFYCRC